MCTLYIRVLAFIVLQCCIESIQEYIIRNRACIAIGLLQVTSVSWSTIINKELTRQRRKCEVSSLLRDVGYNLPAARGSMQELYSYNMVL
jgi:hypothetical protein